MSAPRPAPRPAQAPAQTASPGDWAEAPVSSRSRFGDDVWRFDIHTAGRAECESRIAWGVRLADGSRLTDPRHAPLLRAAKRFLWSLAVDPPRGRKRLSPPSLYAKAHLLRVVMAWMVAEGLTSFRELDPAAVQRLCDWLRERRGKRAGARLAAISVVTYLNVLDAMFRQSDKLDDAPRAAPFPGETTYDAAGATAAAIRRIPAVPDALAVDLLSKALAWVEVHAADILAARDLRARAVAQARAKGLSVQWTYEVVADAMRHVAIAGPDGRPLVNGFEIRRAVLHLGDACFVLIAGFVGMRVSEILSMQVGAIEHRPIGETGVAQAYVAARLFKTAGDPRGRPELWPAPEPVVRAVECLERLSAPLREASGRRDLFLVKNTRHDEVVPLTASHAGTRLNGFARRVGVPDHEGRPWVFSAHQFRKTFARFVARGDRSQLLGLAEHFKHASVAMTSRGYVGTDFQLHELVAREGRAETALALDRLLSSDRLGGRMGERIVARNHAFRGRAGEQVRRDYIDFVLAETDLRVRGCDYGWCVFQAETALCGGEVAPNEAGRSPSVCAKCSNFAADDRHVGYWQDRRRRNLALWDRASPLARAVLAEAVEECDRVLGRIEEGRDGGRAGPDRAGPGATPPDDDAG